MTKNLLCVLLACCASAWAQGNAAATSVTRSQSDLNGRIEVSLHPDHAVGTLEALVRTATVIFQGTVLTTLQTVQRSPNVPYSVETPVVVAVDRIFKGALDNPGATTVFQQGGTIGGLEVVVPEAPLMKPGERYILFLEPELYRTPGPSPRYYIAGGCAGLVKIADGKVMMSAKNSEALKAHHNTDLDAFLKAVDNSIHERGLDLKKTESRADVPWPAPPVRSTSTQ